MAFAIKLSGCPRLFFAAPGVGKLFGKYYRILCLCGVANA
ncbi:hypothetical protein CPter291_2539 [Collimonas pratensis]|uniref:Uncharacterized protein n=1 Tax=Collimonas pratensis TaxID=279113 RepID=A0ABM5Z7F2_9BURK|nr:hypothetical protein CPter291_2539 [Collimonas pratensis]